MYDQFDKKLSDRIKFVFDSYEDDSSDAGWTELRKNFPGTEERPKLLYWISSVAAAIILFTGIWMLMRPERTEQLITKNHRLQTPEKRDIEKNIAYSSGTKDPEVRKKSGAPAPDNTRHRQAKNSGLMVAASFIEQAPQIEEVQNSHVSSASPVSLEAATSTTVAKIDSASAIKAPVYAQVENNRKETEAETVLSTAEKLARLGDIPAEKNKTTSKKSGKVSLGVFAGSFFNYSEGSKANVNTGVGVMSELQVSRKLKISTGVTLAQNTLEFEGMPNQKAYSMMASVAPSVERDQEITNSFVTKTSSLSYSPKGYNASLLGLDIPVNIKYMLLEASKELYVSAGLSSNYFIDESYTYKYSRNSYLVDDTPPEEEATSKTSSFDFARMLNFSVGFGYPVGKQSKLSFEPFVKYPLGGLGAQNIRFGSAGLNLKLNFSTR